MAFAWIHRSSSNLLPINQQMQNRRSAWSSDRSPGWSPRRRSTWGHKLDFYTAMDGKGPGQGAIGVRGCGRGRDLRFRCTLVTMELRAMGPECDFAWALVPKVRPANAVC